MKREIELDQLGDFMAWLGKKALASMAGAGKIEATVECADQLSSNQQYRTGRAANSTSISGRRLRLHDPGPAPNDQFMFYLRASRTELEQEAESVIPPDSPQDDAHVVQAAGTDPEQQPYPGFLEIRFKAGRRSIAATEQAKPAIQKRADRRALQRLRSEGVL